MENYEKNILEKVEGSLQLNSNDNASCRLFIEKFVNCANREKKEKYLDAIVNMARRFGEYKGCDLTAYMNSFTEHGISHSVRIIGFMADLISDFDSLNTETYFYLAASAICHDWGLLISEKDVENIKKNGYISKQSELFNWEATFRQMMLSAGSSAEAEKLSVSAIARGVHAYSEVVVKKIEELCGDDKFIDEREKENLVKICSAHGEDIDHIKKYNWQQDSENSNSVNFGCVVALLRLCDLLDIGYDRISDFVIKNVSGDFENNKHWCANKLVKKVIISYEDEYSPKKCAADIYLNGKICRRCPKEIRIEFSDSKDLHLKGEEIYDAAYSYLLGYIDYIEYEIKENIPQLVCNGFIVPLKDKVRLYCEKKFFYEKLKISESSILELITSETLYGNKRIAIREVLQNAFDACIARKQIKEYAENYIPKVTIRWEKGCLIIEDNGIGMNEEIVRNFFLVVGKSIYHSNRYLFSDRQFLHAGNFGIGVFSLFMITDKITVRTARCGENQKELSFSLKKDNPLIRIERNDAGIFRGTKVIIDKTECFNGLFKDVNELKGYIEKTFSDLDSTDNNSNPFCLAIEKDGQLLKCHFSSFESCYKEKYQKMPNKANVRDLSEYLSGVVCKASFSYLKCKWFFYKGGRFVNNYVRGLFDEGLQDVVVKEYNFNNFAYYFVIPKDIYEMKQEMYENKSYEFHWNLNSIVFDNWSIKNIIGNSEAVKIQNYEHGLKYYAKYSNKMFYKDSGLCSQRNCELFPSVRIFLHNILIENADFDIKTLPNIDVEYIVCNICRNDVIPSLDRNSFDERILKELQIAITYAILNYDIRQERNEFTKYRKIAFLKNFCELNKDNSFIKWENKDA